MKGVVKASGMCGSDPHNYRAPAQPAGAVTGGIQRKAGVIAGHEPCGVVAAVGSGVTDKETKVGQRVMDHHYEGCGAARSISRRSSRTRSAVTCAG